MDQKRIKIYGPPGTGKTTHCVDLLCDHLQGGDRVLFITFTRAAKLEAEGRLVKTFGSVPDYATVSTIHALCKNILGIPSTVLADGYKNKPLFYRMLGMELGKGNLGRKGNIISATLERHQRVRNMQWLWDDECCDTWMDPVSTKALIDQYEGWKQHDGYVDFTDLLQQIADGQGEIPQYDVVIIDEAQDLTKLQWKVAERIYAKANTVYVVGDDDQNVYSFLGVDVSHFIDWPCDAVRVLDRTYRLPRKALVYSQLLAHRIRYRQEKKIIGPDRDGEIYMHLALSEWLGYGARASELFLVRNTYMAKRVQRILVQLGVPFNSPRSPYTGSMAYPEPRLFRTIQLIHRWKDNQLTLKEWGTIKPHMVPLFVTYMEENFKGTKEVTTCGVPTLRFIFKQDNFERKFWWEDLLQAVPYKQVAIFKNALTHYTLEQCANPTLEISTIHGAKGKEADRVYVCSALTKRLFGTLDHEDHEHRLFYVAVTRTKDELYLVNDHEAGTEQYPFPQLTY